MFEQGISNATFQVTSGAICFGSLNDILRGAAATIQVGPSPRPQPSGTIRVQPMEHNIGARNGSWNTFPLLDVKSSSVEGWFAAHSDVDPLNELHKILRVSGSPYEPDHGDGWNTDKTKEQGVFVINRYDWGRWCDNEVTRAEAQEGDEDVGANTNTLGLADYAHGAECVRRWTQDKPSQRTALLSCVWMFIPQAEYMFGRLGLDEEYKEARSFLFFTQRTDFFKTKFPGQNQPLRRYEKIIDIVQRDFREGKDQSGVKRLRDMYAPTSPDPSPKMRNHWDASQPPDKPSLLGPYDANEYIFNEADMDILFAHRPVITGAYLEELTGRKYHTFTAERRKTALVIDPWKSEVVVLLNEAILSYLEYFVFPLRRHILPSEVGPALFPNSTLHMQPNGTVGGRTYRTYSDVLLSVFNGTWSQETAGLRLEPISNRVQAFLNRRSTDSPVSFNEECLTGFARVAARLFTDTIDWADAMALDAQYPRMEVPGSEDCYILPTYARMVIYQNDGLLDRFMYSAYFWHGSGTETM
ncbi:pre-mRNA splicing factor slt11 [Purpureocillium lavendulum]|uniref:Pre-mRNA splicing factor slt11 n=1 Tax=Purpureocillium lavendulum TaxID=1247861 RepID=A0AB34FM64_9HYPO|nr:pre-mRNA splicing factor slt11 [Purpureocillium lavendulum]